MMQPIATAGGSTVDGFFPHADVSYEGRVATVSLPSRTFQMVAEDDIARGMKPHAAIPEGLWAHAADLRIGGGYVNTTIAMKLVAPEVPMRCVDACLIGERLRRRLGYPALDLQGLGLRATPWNAVFGDGRDKLIFKSKASDGSPLSDGQRAKMAWLCECSCVVANSVKDEEVMGFLAHAAGEGKTRLYVVLTKGLPFEFIGKTVLPVASVLFASWDEIDQITGWGVKPTLAGAIEAAVRLRRLAPAAAIYLTLGERGVLVVGPGFSSVCHVRLGPGLWGDLQRFVTQDSSRLCGAGDAFAGGAAIFMEYLRTLAADVDGHHPPMVNAAIAGCAAAVRWIGWGRPLRSADFAVTALPLAAAA